MVVDSSALLALLFGEPTAPGIARILDEHAGELVMSTVNLTETLIRLRDRNPDSYSDLEAQILGSSIQFVPPDAEQARIAASARLQYPLDLGDCFAYALAKTLVLPVLTIDTDFLKTDLKVLAP